LRNGALAGVADDFFGGSGRGFDIDLFIGDVVFGQKAFGLATLQGTRTLSKGLNPFLD